MAQREPIIETLDFDGGIDEVIVNRRSWHGLPPGSRVRVAELKATRSQLLKACVDQELLAPDGSLLVRSAAAVLSAEDSRERAAAIEAQVATAAEAEAQADACRQDDERRLTPLLSQGPVKLNARRIELEERLKRDQEEVEIAKAAVKVADATQRPLVVRVKRGDRAAVKERDAAETRLESAKRALRDAEIVIEADEAQLRPELKELAEAIGILEERERLAAASARDRQAAAVIATLYRTQARAAHELEDATAALRARGRFVIDPLHRVDLLYQFVAGLKLEVPE